MKIQFIGTGGAFDVEYGNSAAILTVSGQNILIDCGHSVFPELVKSGLADTIDAVILTHLHDDHAGSLSSLILYHQIVLNKGKVKIIYQDEAFRDQIYNFLCFSLGKPEKRMEFVPLSDFPMLGVVDTHGQHVVGMQSWALYANSPDSSLVYSGDNGNPDFLFEELKGRGLKTPTRVFHEISFLTQEGGSHAYYKDLIPYLDRYEIFGYHCDPRRNPKDNPIPLVYDKSEMTI